MWTFLLFIVILILCFSFFQRATFLTLLGVGIIYLFSAIAVKVLSYLYPQPLADDMSYTIMVWVLSFSVFVVGGYIMALLADLFKSKWPILISTIIVLLSSSNFESYFLRQSLDLLFLINIVAILVVVLFWKIRNYRINKRSNIPYAASSICIRCEEKVGPVNHFCDNCGQKTFFETTKIECGECGKEAMGHKVPVSLTKESITLRNEDIVASQCANCQAILCHDCMRERLDASAKYFGVNDNNLGTWCKKCFSDARNIDSRYVFVRQGVTAHKLIGRIPRTFALVFDLLIITWIPFFIFSLIFLFFAGIGYMFQPRAGQIFISREGLGLSNLVGGLLSMDSLYSAIFLIGISISLIVYIIYRITDKPHGIACGWLSDSCLKCNKKLLESYMLSQKEGANVTIAKA